MKKLLLTLITLFTVSSHAAIPMKVAFCDDCSDYQYESSAIAMKKQQDVFVIDGTKNSIRYYSVRSHFVDDRIEVFTATEKQISDVTLAATQNMFAKRDAFFNQLRSQYGSLSINVADVLESSNTSNIKLDPITVTDMDIFEFASTPAYRNYIYKELVKNPTYGELRQAKSVMAQIMSIGYSLVTLNFSQVSGMQNELLINFKFGEIAKVVFNDKTGQFDVVSMEDEKQNSIPLPGVPIGNLATRFNVDSVGHAARIEAHLNRWDVRFENRVRPPNSIIPLHGLQCSFNCGMSGGMLVCVKECR